MADTADMAPSRAKSSSTRSRARSRRSGEDLEKQIDRLQEDIKAIAKSVSHIAERKVGQAQDRAESEVSGLMKSGQQAIDAVQDEFGDMERQLKDTIRRKPLTAVAGAVALGFVLALISR